MENDTLETTQAVVPIATNVKRPENTLLSLRKPLDLLEKPIFIGLLLTFGVGIAFFLWGAQPNTPTVSKTSEQADSLSANGNKVAVALIQGNYQHSFKHLKRMDVYYREARDLLMDFKYAEVVKKCDSALLCKTDKPLNWSPQKWGDVYNIKAESLLYLGNIKEAEIAATNALKMDKQDKLGYLHLIYAQILAGKDKKATPLFLDNFKYALKKHLPLWDYMELDGFDAVKNDPSVKKLLKQYQ